MRVEFAIDERPGVKTDAFEGEAGFGGLVSKEARENGMHNLIYEVNVDLIVIGDLYEERDVVVIAVDVFHIEHVFNGADLGRLRKRSARFVLG
jgi:hypothetical protein